MHLVQCLANLPMFKALKVFKPAEIDTYIKKPLATRVGKLVEIAELVISEELKVAMRQDAGVASRRKAALDA